MARYVMIEDRLSYVDSALERLRRAVPGGLEKGALAFSSHRKVLADSAGLELLADAELVLLDAYDYDSQQEDPTASKAGALHVCEQLSQLAKPPPVVVYSVYIRSPEINIPIREYPFVTTCLDHHQLLESLPELIAGRPPQSDAAPPTPADYRDLGVGAGAQVTRAYHLYRTRPDAWELVYRDGYNGARRTREWINDRVHPLLDIAVQSYKPVVEVMRRISGLPRMAPRQ